MGDMSVVIVLFLIFTVFLIVLDIAMVVSLVKPGDERKQMIVWKASAGTLIGVVGVMFIDIFKSIAAPDSIVSPFSRLGGTAIVYFVFLMYYKRKYGG